MNQQRKTNYRADLAQILSKTGSQSEAAIPILQAIQEKYGYLPTEMLKLISKETSIPASELYGIATFYAQFKLNPVGQNIIKICKGTACHVNGADMLFDTIKSELDFGADETTKDGKFTLEIVACLGCCSLAPVVMINDDIHGNLTSTKLRKILKQY